MGRATGLGQQLLGVGGGGVAPGQSASILESSLDPLGVVQHLDRSPASLRTRMCRSGERRDLRQAWALR